MEWRLILILVLMVVVVIFSLANAGPVEFNFLFGEREISLALIITISALVGAVAAVIAGLSSQLRLRHQLHEKERQMRELTKEKTDLAGDVRAQRLNKRPPRPGRE
jgi:lipopolysaccharide assembly protein A